MPFFSIILPTYNSGVTLSACLQSIILQNFDDFEIIISDGVSTDNTLQLAADFKDSRILIFSEPDKGTYDAMNKAIDLASGEWIYFLGSDDRLIDEHVLGQVAEKLKSTRAALVYGNVKIAGDSDWAKDGEIYRGETPLDILFECNISHQSIFYSRHVFENKLRYNLDYSVCADHDLNLYCASIFTMEYIPITIAVFTSGGLSSVKPDKKFIRDKWSNIVRYYQTRLLDPGMPNSRNGVKRTIKLFVSQLEFGLTILAVRIYLYHSIKKWS